MRSYPQSKEEHPQIPQMYADSAKDMVFDILSSPSLRKSAPSADDVRNCRALRTIAKRTGWHILTAWALLLPAISLAAEPAKKPPALDPATCELVLEGKHFERLVLIGPNGSRKEILRPGASVLLPPGQYGIIEFQLQGGYTCELYPGRPLGVAFDPERLTLAPGKPCRPRFGAPLNPSVTVKRSGRLLTMDYVLLDADGRKYRKNNPGDDRAHPPQFAVYQGDSQIGSGTFEYG
jgi:hypothetical protein